MFFSGLELLYNVFLLSKLDGSRSFSGLGRMDHGLSPVWVGLIMIYYDLGRMDYVFLCGSCLSLVWVGLIMLSSGLGLIRAENRGCQG